MSRTRVVSTWVVSCARRTPISRGRAARASTAPRLERQIVVLLIQRLRELVERLRFALGGHLRRGLGACVFPPPPPPPPPPPASPPPPPAPPPTAPSALPLGDSMISSRAMTSVV